MRSHRLAGGHTVFRTLGSFADAPLRHHCSLLSRPSLDLTEGRLPIRTGDDNGNPEGFKYETSNAWRGASIDICRNGFHRFNRF
jgi:hypothetical protein